MQRLVQVKLMGFSMIFIIVLLSGYYWKIERKKYKKKPVVKKKLVEFQQYLHPKENDENHQQILWVALCGTVFDVTNDSFFQQNKMGVYSHWVGHDITHHLLSMAFYTPSKSTQQESFDVPIYIDVIQDPQRAQVLEQWYRRLSTRYQIIGQLEDLFNTPEWALYRKDKLDSTSATQAKCPLGFGASKSSSTAPKLQVKYSTNSTEFVWFLGQKYDVSSSEAFGPDGLFHPYIGQDITLLLATNGTADGTAPESYDKSSSPRAFTFTYEEQKRLHHFREIFTREFPVVLDTNKENISEIAPLTSSLHELLDNDVESQTFIEEIRKELVNSNKNTINAVCPRTGLSLLHKAVEKNRLDLVKVLVEEANADTCANASLYDDDTPLELAKRFRLQEICQYLTTSTVD